MINFLINLFHFHRWATVTTYYGDQIKEHGNKRHLMKCRTCGKYKTV